MTHVMQTQHAFGLPVTRRRALQAAVAAAAASLVRPGRLLAELPRGKAHWLVTIDGGPSERGWKYGAQFEEDITKFLEREIYSAFVGQPATRAALLHYAARCGNEIEKYSPVVAEEMHAMAAGCGLKAEEIVLLSLHEELYHKGAIPSQDHCHVAAAGPPVTNGDTFVGQTWDWMASVYGLSQMLHWKRNEGPHVLAYGYPGMWIGAGLNSAGIAHCWTSAFNDPSGNKSPRVGIPSYALIAHLLYQESLEAVAEEARRAKHAGWFTFVFADGNGNFLNVEGSPMELAIERSRESMVRHQYCSRKITRTPAEQSPPRLGASNFLIEQLEKRENKLDTTDVQQLLADPHVGSHALDLMVFNTTKKEAYVTRGPGERAQWQTFGFA